MQSLTNPIQSIYSFLVDLILPFQLQQYFAFRFVSFRNLFFINRLSFSELFRDCLQKMHILDDICEIILVGLKILFPKKS
jgi:hypothetical protein